MTAPAAVSPLTKKGRLLALLGQMKTERSSWESDWKECAEFITPRRYRASTSDKNKGGRGTGKIIDSTATFALRTLASGMMSGLSSPARPWFRLTTKEQELLELGEVKAWLADVTKRLLVIIGKSNAYTKFEAMYKDLGAFGLSAISVVKDGRRVIHCDHYPVGTYVVAVNAKGEVTGFGREFKLSADQIVREFATAPDGRSVGWSRVSREVRSAWMGGNRTALFDVVHMITENAQWDSSKLESYRKRFYACYFEPGGDDRVFLREEGFDDFPVLVPRWEALGGDAYAVEWPGAVALGDVKALQLGEKMLAKAVAKMVDPPVKGPSSLKNQRASLLPGDINWEDGTSGEGLRPVHEVKPDTLKLHELQAMTRERINRAFFADLFLMLASAPQRSNVTAREIEERREEKLLALGPVLERLNTEFFDPFINLVFRHALEAGLLPEPPEILQGSDLPVEYISILAQAQKMVALAGIDHLTSRALEIGAVRPDALDKIDWDQVLDEVADATGAPPRVVIPDEQVAEVRTARAEAAAQQQQAEMAAQQATAMQKMAQTDTSGQNALTDLLTTTAGPMAGDGGMMMEGM